MLMSLSQISNAEETPGVINDQVHATAFEWNLDADHSAHPPLVAVHRHLDPGGSGTSLPVGGGPVDKPQD